MPTPVLFDPTKWTIPPRPSHVFSFSITSFFDNSVEDVFSFCRDGLNYPKIFPEPIVPVEGFDDFWVKPGHVYAFKHWMKGVWPVVWQVYISEFEDNRFYVDEQLKGFFRYFRHRHECRPLNGGTVYTDTIEFRSFFPGWVDSFWVKRELEKVFACRHRNMRVLLGGEGGFDKEK